MNQMLTTGKLVAPGGPGTAALKEFRRILRLCEKAGNLAQAVPKLNVVTFD